MSYIENHNSAEDCVFCDAPSRPDGPDNLIVFRGSGAYVILNRFPYTSGHLMIVPFQHEPSIESLDLPVLTEMMALSRTALQVMRTAYRPEGFNIGINLGDAAGAGIADHVHMHIVPRWVGDTNFMATLGETRVLPEALETTYERIHKAWLSI
jgi:ATP adenylyltransferase